MNRLGKCAAAALVAALTTMCGVPAGAQAADLEVIQTPTGRTCADGGKPPGGDWPGLNNGPANTRHQAAEQTIGPDEAAALAPAWSFSGAEVGATGGMRSTPVVANGCVYIGFGQGYLGDRGDIVALDAQTGELVWRVRLNASVLGLAVSGGTVYAAPSMGTRGEVAMPVVTDTYAPAGSYALALNAKTGEHRWTSDRLDDGNAANGTFINATPVAYSAGSRDLVFVPLSGGSGDGARVPMYFLDARTGKTVRKAYSLSEADYLQGFGGTGIWSTAAYDPAGRHLYAGTADSDGHTRQHPYNNAILKIDADPRRPTFGKVLDSYKGISEHADLDAVVGYPNNPLCSSVAGAPEVDLPTFFDTSSSVECLELDLDFGASPMLHRAGDALRVSGLQKAGVFHSVDTGSMEAAWKVFVGPGGPFQHSGTAALLGDRIAVGATPNLVFGLGATDGALGWVAQTGLDVFAYQPLTSANGVLYAINDSGSLLVHDADGGTPLGTRSIAVDGGFSQCLGVGAGVAVARNTVFVPCDAGGPVDLAGLPADPGGLVAYRAP
jgi:outer membrane protein assembly factor BamB